jgi:peptidoglycan/LPS O-acetylase OafA/YrhL
MLVLPAACLGAMRVMLLDAFPETHALFDDWYNHTHYLALFLLGALLARHAGFWDALAVQRRHALLIALVGWACLVAYFGHYGEARMPPDWLRALQRMVHAAVEWNAIIAACGFARRYLNHDNAARRYLTQAVFPVYILHQTLIVIFAHALKPAELEAWPEASLLFAATLACSFAVFEAVRRVPLLRPWFGLGRG